jgi:hypothetical protein
VSGVRGDKPGKVRHAAMGLAHIVTTEDGQRQLVNFRDDNGMGHATCNIMQCANIWCIIMIK